MAPSARLAGMCARSEGAIMNVPGLSPPAGPSPTSPMRRSLARIFLLGGLMALVVACPRTPPPVDEEDTGDEGVPSVEHGGDAGVPWAEQCELATPPDPCGPLVLPDAGPVPSPEAWCEESARLRCAAWMAAGTLDPSVASACADVEARACELRFPAAFREAGYLTYWPEAASACLTESGRPDVPACSCVFLRGEPGAPCGGDIHCRTGYCLREQGRPGRCVQCPPLLPLGSTCGESGQPPCVGNAPCVEGRCVSTVGEKCGGIPYRQCGPDSARCSDTCIETCRGGTCLPFMQEGARCGLDPLCGSRPQQLCNLGTCEPGLVCTYLSTELSSYGSCQPTGVYCAGNMQGCGPDQICMRPFGRCITPYSLSSGEPCTGMRQCALGLRCLLGGGSADGGSSQRICTPAQGLCDEDSHCPWAQRCVAGQCMTPPALGAACAAPSACDPYLICARQADGGVCSPKPRIGERCAFDSPDGGPRWRYSCAEGLCMSDGFCH
jgi:hypothetical protein